MAKILAHNEEQNSINGSVNYIEDKYKALVAGILEQAQKDLYDALIKKEYGKVRVLKKWFRSEWGQKLSGCNGQLIIDRVVAESNKFLKNN